MLVRVYVLFQRGVGTKSCRPLSQTDSDSTLGLALSPASLEARGGKHTLRFCFSSHICHSVASCGRIEASPFGMVRTPATYHYGGTSCSDASLYASSADERERGYRSTLSQCGSENGKNAVLGPLCVVSSCSRGNTGKGRGAESCDKQFVARNSWLDQLGAMTPLMHISVGDKSSLSSVWRV